MSLVSSTKTVFDLFKLNISSHVQDTVLHAPEKKKNKKRKLSLERSKGKNKVNVH